jgi:hypothetical protein
MRQFIEYNIVISVCLANQAKHIINYIKKIKREGVGSLANDVAFHDKHIVIKLQR